MNSCLFNLQLPQTYRKFAFFEMSIALDSPSHNKSRSAINDSQYQCTFAAVNRCCSLTLHYIYIKSNLGFRTTRIMKNTVYEHIFRTQRFSDDVLCLELQTLKQSRVVPRERRKKKIPLPNSNISLPHQLPLKPLTPLHVGAVNLN